MLWACVTTITWSVYQGCDFEVIFVGPGSDLTSRIIAATTEFLKREAGAKVTVVSDLSGRPSSITSQVFVSTLRLFHHYYTSFSNDTVVYTADTDMVPLHKYAFKEQLPSNCIWSHIWANEHTPMQAKSSKPNFALGNTFFENGRSTALPACRNENDPGKFKKIREQCYKGVAQLAFFSNNTGKLENIISCSHPRE